MNQFELTALHEFARREGRVWKLRLRHAWMKACVDLPEQVSLDAHTSIEYRGALQRLRNDPAFGPRGLAKYRLNYKTGKAV